MAWGRLLFAIDPRRELGSLLPMVAGGGTKLIFSGSMEALLKVVQAGRISPETQKALQAMRIGPPHKLEPAYPAENWAKAVKLISADLFPGTDLFVQHRALGMATVLHEEI